MADIPFLSKSIRVSISSSYWWSLFRKSWFGWVRKKPWVLCCSGINLRLDFVLFFYLFFIQSCSVNVLMLIGTSYFCHIFSSFSFFFYFLMMVRNFWLCSLAGKTSNFELNCGAGLWLMAHSRLSGVNQPVSWLKFRAHSWQNVQRQRSPFPVWFCFLFISFLISCN